MECHVYWSLNSSCFKFLQMKKYGIFSAKKLLEIWYLLITEKFLFLSFQECEIRSFLSQKVDGRMIFTDYWKFLVLNFSVMEKWSFLDPKSWWKDYILGLFELSMIFQDLGNMVFLAVCYWSISKNSDASFSLAFSISTGIVKKLLKIKKKEEE